MARILIADDEPETSDWSPTFAGIAGINLFIMIPPRRRSMPCPMCAPQLVIADLQSEKTNGFDILRECRKTSSDRGGDDCTLSRLSNWHSESNAIRGL